MPLIGRIIPEFQDVNLREIIFQNYWIIYRIKRDIDIEILTVIHSARDFEAIFDVTQQ